MHLLGGQQIRQRIDHVAFDGALQVACAITLVRAFLKQEVPASRRHAEEELPLGRFQNPLLHLA